MSIILGIDIGTTSVKLAFTNASNNTIMAYHSLSTNANVIQDSTRDEQCPQKIISTFENCLAKCEPSLLSRVKAIGVCGQMHGAMMWNTEYDLHCPDKKNFSNLVTWQDARCSQEFLASLPAPSCGRLSSGFGCATMMWYLKNDPVHMKRYSHAGTIMDFLVAHLTGNVCMSTQNAASWGYFNPAELKWDTEKLASEHFPIHLLPKLVEAGSEAGLTRCSMHNIPEGIPVTAALGDLQCSTLASISDNKYAALNIGTSSQIAFELCDKQLLVPKSVDLFPYFHGRRLAVAASLNGGNIIGAFVDMLQEWMLQLGVEIERTKIWTKLQSFQEYEDDAIRIEPALNGERHDPELRASATNISPHNLKLSSVYQSLCHGLVTNLTSIMPTEFLIANRIEKVIATGSVIEKNRMVGEHIKRAFHVDVEFAESAEAASAYGAALAAREICSK